MTLRELLPPELVIGEGLEDIDITRISYNSQHVRPGSLFVAMRGVHTDGHRFIHDAVRRGAVAVLAEELPAENHIPVPVFLVPDTRVALAKVASAFYGHPARRLKVIGVTGTDGKTTTSLLIGQLLERAGLRTGVITTVRFRAGGIEWANDSRQTTPEAVEVQQLLAQMVSSGDQYAVVESTSHGLALHRLDYCEYDVAVLTNVTHEHLDFHGTIERYRADKARLFQALDTSPDKGIDKVAIVNADDPHCDFFRSNTRARVVTYGVKANSDVRAESITPSSFGNRFTVVAAGSRANVELPLVGDFNVYNVLAALSAGLSQGIELAAAAEALRYSKGAPGRMESIDEGQSFSVIVDYAHTPESLAKVLSILRPVTRGKLIVVFGSAGERDTAKRAWQGRIAAEMCDFCVFTNEDPRFEDENKIIEEIAAGAESAGRVNGLDFAKIPDRREAIAEAFRKAMLGDTVLLAGKGHEQCIIVGNSRIPWDEATVARELLVAQAGARAFYRA